MAKQKQRQRSSTNPLAHLRFNIRDVERVDKHMLGTPLERVASALLYNSWELVNLLAMPNALLNQGASDMYLVSIYMSIYEQTQADVDLRKLYKTDRQLRQYAIKEATKLHENHYVHGKGYTNIEEYTGGQLEILHKECDQFRSAVHALLRHAIIFAWTIFECAAKDTWVMFLNSAPHVITRMLPALSHLDGNSGVTSKSIQLGLVARYDFDLREHMGDLLATKFDFTSLLGIKNAFGSVLPPHGPSPFDGPSLSELEATRHVLVHRGGIVDAEFKKRIPKSPDVGQRIVLEPDSVSNMINASFAAACALLTKMHALYAAGTRPSETQGNITTE